MSDWQRWDAAAHDRYVTGNYGEDQDLADDDDQAEEELDELDDPIGDAIEARAQEAAGYASEQIRPVVHNDTPAPTPSGNNWTAQIPLDAFSGLWQLVWREMDDTVRLEAVGQFYAVLPFADFMARVRLLADAREQYAPYLAARESEASHDE